jgi:ribosomal protein S27AE
MSEWFCEDCDKTISADDYVHHNADHSMYRIVSTGTVAVCPFCGTGILALHLGGPWDKQIHCSKCGKAWVYLSDEAMEGIVAEWINRRSATQEAT